MCPRAVPLEDPSRDGPATAREIGQDEDVTV